MSLLGLLIYFMLNKSIIFFKIVDSKLSACYYLIVCEIVCMQRLIIKQQYAAVLLHDLIMLHV